MSNMRNLGINPVTGGQQLGTAAALLIFSPQVQHLKNTQRTPVRYCTCRVTLPSGEVKVMNAIMYEKNFQKGGFKLGDSLALKVEINKGYENPILILSNLHAGERATKADFAAAFAEFENEPAVTSGVTAGNIREMQPSEEEA